MAKRFRVNILSSSSVNALKKELERYRDSLDYKCALVAERLASLGVEIARVQVADLDAIFTGELLGSIHSEYRSSQPHGAIFAVVADSLHAVFVEFGTGTKGADHPYQGTMPTGMTWNYNSGKTIRDYIINGQKLYGWFYPGKDGKMHFTQGMPSRPFMSNTADELEARVVEVVREVFS